MYNNNQMHAQTLLTKQIAYRLILKAKKTTQPGTGLLFAPKENKQVNSEFVKLVVCDIQQADKYLNKEIQICLSIKKEYTASMQKFIQHYSQLSKVFGNQNVISVLLEYESQNGQSLLKILRFFQSKEYFVFVKAHLRAHNLNQYQNKLAQISEHLFQQPMVVLQGISLIVDLPVMGQTSLQQNAIILTAIWRRTIPPSLGSLVLIDWIYSEQTKTIFKLHFLKNMKINWFLQFFTDKMEDCEALGCQCCGIN